MTDADLIETASARDRAIRLLPDQYGSDDYNNPDYYNNYDNYDQPVAYAPQAPPPLPEYDQPPCPGDGYIWTPGYWNYASDGYYWVPGAWVSAPYQGALWTPGYWSYNQNRYGWHRGYWGRHVGYYGGINYGHGYVGSGYQGGYWQGNQFAYNRSVNNVNTTSVRNVYNYTVVNNTTTINRVSYNGPGGVQARPKPSDIAALHEQHNPPMTAQMQQVKAAQANRDNFAAVNHGRPQTVAVAQPLPADHNIRPPAAVPMRPFTVRAAQSAPVAITTRAVQPAGQPQPREQEPAAWPNQPNGRLHRIQQQQQRPAPVQQPMRPQPPPQQHAQPAPERQAPQQHAQPAPQRQQPQPQQPKPEQRPAPVQHPQQQAAPERPAPVPTASGCVHSDRRRRNSDRLRLLNGRRPRLKKRSSSAPRQSLIHKTSRRLRSSMLFRHRSMRLKASRRLNRNRKRKTRSLSKDVPAALSAYSWRCWE